RCRHAAKAGRPRPRRAGSRRVGTGRRPRRIRPGAKGRAVNDGWLIACLATMAVALVAMAIGQLVLALTAARVARQTTDTVQEFRRELRPVIEKVQKIVDDASRTSAIALV